MYAYVILSLVLAVLATDFAQGAPPDAATALAGLGDVVALVLVAGLGIGLYVRRGGALLAADEQRFLRRVGLLGRLFRLAVAGAYAFVLFALNWAALAAHWAGPGGWLLARFAVVLAPLVVLLATAWVALFAADRRLRALLFERAGAAVAVRQWTLPRYLEFTFRQYLLILLAPLLVLVAADDAVSRVLGPPGEQPLSAAVLLALVVAAMLLAGPWFRVCWRTERFPDSPLRDRLKALAERAGVRVADILVWRTNVTIANGCMVGTVGPLRYIMITDALLLSLAPEQVEAVFAHEVAHVKFKHIALYMIMALGGISAAVGAGEIASYLGGSIWTQNAAVGTVALVYWLPCFGFVSRRCEQECDLYAVRATACPVGCSPPDAGARARRAEVVAGESAAAVAAAAGQAPPAALAPRDGPDVAPMGLCGHRVAAFVAALRRIARLNGSPETARGWRHFSIARRCRFLLDVSADPSLAALAQRRLRKMKLAVLLASILLLAATGAIIAVLEGPLQPDHPEHPAGPEDVAPRKDTWLTRVIYRDQVHGVSLGAPQFDRDADAAAHPDDGGLARLRGGVAVRNDDVAIQDPRRHAVAVHTQAEGARGDGPQPGQVEELDNPIGRRRA
jgi:Zn-dependent protease with chaperone function